MYARYIPPASTQYRVAPGLKRKRAPAESIEEAPIEGKLLKKSRKTKEKSESQDSAISSAQKLGHGNDTGREGNGTTQLEDQAQWVKGPKRGKMKKEKSMPAESVDNTSAEKIGSLEEDAAETGLPIRSKSRHKPKGNPTDTGDAGSNIKRIKEQYGLDISAKGENRVVAEEPGKKSQKSKKKKNKKQQTNETNGDGNGNGAMGDTDVNMAGVTEEVVPQKIHDSVKEKGNRGTQPEDIAQDESDTNSEQDTDKQSKHKSILNKFQRSAKISEKLVTEISNEGQEISEDKEQTEVQGLVPLPQPEQVVNPSGRLAFSALPSWLAQPITVSSASVTAFPNLGINTKLISILEAKGYKEAFAVQSAALPLLLPGPNQHIGDICISAATGSGKTLAYVLPLVESLRSRTITRLRGLIIVPTKELVIQAKEVCKICSSGSGLKVGFALGSRPIKIERDQLIKRTPRYDPVAYATLQKRSKDPELDLDYDSPCEDSGFDTNFEVLPDHIIDHSSNVDILIATPGRLVEHIRSTPGFTLDYLQWLVIDEADRLLSQSFQEWTYVVLGAAEKKKEYDQLNVQEQILTEMGLHRKNAHVRKVVLSATMTRDVGKLSALKLRNPKLIVVDDYGSVKAQSSFDHDQKEGGMDEELVTTDGDAFQLPPTLKEWAVAVGDGSEKPLYLLALLRTKIFTDDSSCNPFKAGILEGKVSGAEDENELADSTDSTTESSSSDDDFSNDSSDDSSPGDLSISDNSDLSDISGDDSSLEPFPSEPSSPEDSSLGSSSSEDSSSDGSTDDSENGMSIHSSPARSCRLNPCPQKDRPTYQPLSRPKISTTERKSSPTAVLIFTRSTSSALRLSRLLSLLHPFLSTKIGTLTSSIPASKRRKLLSAFRRHEKPILIASDLVARGLDLEKLGHIVNYDLPTTVRSYVHRVGRTARAGRKGVAWSLVTEKEARWFWRCVGGRGEETLCIQRGEGREVRRAKVGPNEEEQGAYEEALQMLKEEVKGR